MEFSKERIDEIAEFMLLKGITIPEGMNIPELEDALKKFSKIQDADPMDNIEIVNQKKESNFSILRNAGLAEMEKLKENK